MLVLFLLNWALLYQSKGLSICLHDSILLTLLEQQSRLDIILHFSFFQFAVEEDLFNCYILEWSNKAALERKWGDKLGKGKNKEFPWGGRENKWDAWRHQYLIPHWNPTNLCSSIKRPNFFSELPVVYNLIPVARIQISVSLSFFFFIL